MRLEPDILAADQFLPRTFATPEQRLLLAVLEEALGTYQRYAGAPDRRSRALFVDVEGWFASDDAAELYSFAGICDALGIEPAYVRALLALWADVRRSARDALESAVLGA